MSERIDYAITPDADAAEVAALFDAAALNWPRGDLPRLARMLANAQLVVTARAGSRLVGLARTLTDFELNGFIADLAVLPSYQRRGIGRELIRVTLETGRCVKYLIHPTTDSLDFYLRLGFQLASPCVLYPRATSAQ